MGRYSLELSGESVVVSYVGPAGTHSDIQGTFSTKRK